MVSGVSWDKIESDAQAGATLMKLKPKHGWNNIPLFEGTSKPSSYPPARPLFKVIVAVVVIGGLLYLFFSGR